MPLPINMNTHDNVKSTLDKVLHDIITPATEFKIHQKELNRIKHALAPMFISAKRVSENECYVVILQEETLNVYVFNAHHIATNHFLDIIGKNPGVTIIRLTNNLSNIKPFEEKPSSRLQKLCRIYKNDFVNFMQQYDVPESYLIRLTKESIVQNELIEIIQKLRKAILSTYEEYTNNKRLISLHIFDYEYMKSTTNTSIKDDAPYLYQCTRAAISNTNISQDTFDNVLINNGPFPEIISLTAALSIFNYDIIQRRS